jgi:hypothetical protein
VLGDHAARRGISGAGVESQTRKRSTSTPSLGQLMLPNGPRAIITAATTTVTAI